MHPARREMRPARAMTFAELEAMLPPEDHYLRGILLRPAGAGAYAWMADHEVAQPGDDVVFYAIDKNDVDQLNALNIEFDRHYYPRQSGIRPDEEALIETRLPPAGAKILEICCGAGRITTHLVREGNAVTGLDFNPHTLEVARERDPRVEYVLGDATALPFEDARFDISCCLENGFGVLFTRAPVALAELIRVTRPGGFVLVGLREQEGRADHFHVYLTDNGHVSVAQTFDAASVERILAALPGEAAARVAAREDFPGAERPWGGHTFYLQLELR